jgi:hypothetical protein
VEYVANRPKRVKQDRAQKALGFTGTSELEEWPFLSAYYDLYSNHPAEYGENEEELVGALYAGEPSVNCVGEHIGKLRKLYEFRNGSAVERFLEEKPFLIQLLFDAYKKVREFFEPSSRLILAIVADPEEQEEQELFLFIQTGLPPQAARTLLAVLNKEWWLDAMLRAKGEMNISLEYTPSR